MNSKLRSHIVLNLLKTLHEYYKSNENISDEVIHYMIPIIQRLRPEEAIKFYQDDKLSNTSDGFAMIHFSIIQYMQDETLEALIMHICEYINVLGYDRATRIKLDFILFENTGDDTAQKLKIIKDVLQLNINKNIEKIKEEERVGVDDSLLVANTYYISILRNKNEKFSSYLDILNSK